MGSPRSGSSAHRKTALDGPVPRHGVRRARQVRRRRAGVLLGIAIAAIAVALLAAGGGKSPVKTQARAGSAGISRARPARVRVQAVQTGALPRAEQDSAAVVVSAGNFLLIGGIDQAEASLASIVSANDSQARTIGTLSTNLHDASASFVGGAAYLFGGGVLSSFSQITRVDANGSSQPAGQLPTPASDVTSATIGETVYIVGGYTGQTPLRTILAWRPGEHTHVAGMLPKPLRYAAAAVAGGQLVIVGGTSGEAASQDIYRFDPPTRRLTILGVLPRPLTHAAVAELNGTVFVFGGRGSSPTSQTRQILAISANGKVQPVGMLPAALSDLAAVSLGGHIVIAGGRDGGGHVHDEILTATVATA
jgi:N-acetylneuraminic acid mutarotase